MHNTTPFYTFKSNCCLIMPIVQCRELRGAPCMHEQAKEGNEYIKS